MKTSWKWQVEMGLLAIALACLASIAKAGSEVVPANAPVFLDRAEKAIRALMAASDDGDFVLVMQLMRLRGSAEDRLLIRQCAARPHKASPDAEVAAVEPLIRDAAVAMAVGERETVLEKLAAADEKVKGLAHDMVKDLLLSECLYFRAKLGDADDVMDRIKRDPSSSVAAISIVLDAYARGDKVTLEKFLPIADSGYTFERMGRLVEAEKAAGLVTRSGTRAQHLRRIAGAYKASGDSAGCRRCLLAARRAVDEDPYVSSGSLASFGIDAVRLGEREVALAALEAAAKRFSEHSNTSAYYEARLAATLGDQVKATAFATQFEASWERELIGLRDRAEKEKIKPDVIDLGNGKSYTYVTDVLEKTAEHELKRASLAVAAGDLNEMNVRLLASVKIKRLGRYGNADGFWDAVDSLADRHDYAACERLIQTLALGKEDIADIHGALAQQAVNDGQWDEAWTYLKSCHGDRWTGWRMRICEHWLGAGSLEKCIELLDSVGSPYDRGLIALRLAARCKGFPGADALDICLRSEARS